MKRIYLFMMLMVSVMPLMASGSDYEVSTSGALAYNGSQAQSLDGKEKSVALIAAFTARGDMERLDESFDTGLDAGLTVNEVKEILVQMYAYCGFPRSLNALNRFMAKTEQRAAAGKQDEIGKEASPVPAGTDMSALGEEMRTRLVGRPVTGKVYEFCPVIDGYLRSLSPPRRPTSVSRLWQHSACSTPDLCAATDFSTHRLTPFRNVLPMPAPPVSVRR